MKRVGAPLRLLGQCLLVAGLWGTESFVEAAPPPPDAEAVLEALRHADQSRAMEQTEAQAWHEERARLELLLATVDDQVRQTAAEAEAHRAQLNELRASLRVVEPMDERRRALAEVAGQIARNIHAALERIRARVTPGVVAEPKKESDSGAGDALDRAIARLEDTERAAAKTLVTLATGRLGSETIAVELLRVGAAAAWYRALDGSSAGTTVIQDGQLILHPARNPDVVHEIAIACDIAKGRTAPRVVRMPISQVSVNGIPTP